MKAVATREIISEILNDHKILKTLFREGLRRGAAAKGTSLDSKRRVFEELAIILTAHAKSEEATLYAPTFRIEETKKDAFIGFEEHQLIELLIEEMKSETNPDKWEAKFTVVCEMLETHLENEEEEYLPLIEEVCSREERIRMGREYRETFQRLESAQRQILHPFSDKEQTKNH